MPLKKSFSLIIYIDGKFITGDGWSVDSLSPGVVKGRGVFETMRFYQGRIFAYKEHWSRLERGLKSLRIKNHCPKGKIKRIIRGVVKVNRLKAARLRLMIWEYKKKAHIVVIAQPFSDFKQSFAVTVSGIRAKRTTYSHLKTLDYGRFYQAFQEAKHKGCDEAILLDRHKNVVEGSRSNIFYVSKGALHTPDIKSGCLNGITREIVLQLARKLGLQRVVSKKILVEDLIYGEEAFLTNSVWEIMPLTKVDEYKIGQGCAGPVTLKLLQAYRNMVKKS